MRGARLAALPPLLLLGLQGCQPLPQEAVCQGVLTTYCSEWDSFLSEPPLDERKQRALPVFDRECKKFMGGDKWTFTESTLWPLCLGCAGGGTPEAEVQRCLFDAAVKPPDSGVVRQVCAQNIRTYCEQWKQELDGLAEGSEAKPVFDAECGKYLGGSPELLMESPLWAKCLPCAHLVDADAEHCLVAAAKATARPGQGMDAAGGIARPLSKSRRLWAAQGPPPCSGAYQGVVPSAEMDTFVKLATEARCWGYAKSRHDKDVTDGDNIPLDGRCFRLVMMPVASPDGEQRGERKCLPAIKGTSGTAGETGLKYEPPLFDECECSGREAAAGAEAMVKEAIDSAPDLGVAPDLKTDATGSLLDATGARRFPEPAAAGAAVEVRADGETAAGDPPLARRIDAEARRLAAP